MGTKPTVKMPPGDGGPKVRMGGLSLGLRVLGFWRSGFWGLGFKVSGCQSLGLRFRTVVPDCSAGVQLKRLSASLGLLCSTSRD